MTRDAAGAPLVSAVIPTYDRPSLLREAVESVVAQTYPAIELVVVDDGSTTPAEAVLDGLDEGNLVDRRIYRHEENRGANAARNTGVRAANGAFVAFLDDDDRWLPTKIERQVAAFEGAPDAVGIVFTGQKFVDETGSVTNVARPTVEGDLTRNLTRNVDLGPFSTIVVRAEVFDEAGRLDESFPCWQDKEWYFRVGEHYDMASVPEPLTIRQDAGEGKISDRYEAKRDVAYPKLVAKHRSRAAELGPRHERAFVASLQFGVAVSGLVNGWHRDAIRYLLRSIRNRPTAPRAYLYLLVAMAGPAAVTPLQKLKRGANRLLHRLHGRDDPA